MCGGGALNGQNTGKYAVSSVSKAVVVSWGCFVLTKQHGVVLIGLNLLVHRILGMKMMSRVFVLIAVLNLSGVHC